MGDEFIYKVEVKGRMILKWNKANSSNPTFWSIEDRIIFSQGSCGWNCYQERVSIQLMLGGIEYIK